ncbi:MAG: hypothetical protein WAM44_16815 [Chthoniobacterales bacterium]
MPSCVIVGHFSSSVLTSFCDSSQNNPIFDRLAVRPEQAGKGKTVDDDVCLPELDRPTLGSFLASLIIVDENARSLVLQVGYLQGWNEDRLWPIVKQALEV